MGARFNSHFVYVIDKNNNPHFVLNGYNADLGDSYRSDIYLKNKSYCVLDLYLTDEVEEEGEFLPRVKESEWKDFLPVGPSADAAIIMAEAELTEVAIEKLVFIWISSSSCNVLDYGGFVSSREGVQYFDQDFLNQALSFARTKTGSPAEQEGIIAEWMIEQVLKGNYTTTK